MSIEKLLHDIVMSPPSEGKVARLYLIANWAILLLRKLDDWTSENADHGSRCPFDITGARPRCEGCTCGLKALSSELTEFLEAVKPIEGG